MHPTLIVSGQTAVIRLNRPTKRNCLTSADIQLLRSHIAEVNLLDAVKILILQSEGEVFCSGFDFESLALLANTPAGKSDLEFANLCDDLEAARPITIASIHAPVYGGGTDLVLACDFRIGCDTIVLELAASKIGISYYGSGLRRWVSRLGLGAANKVFLLAQRLNANELEQIGYLTHLCVRSEMNKMLNDLSSALISAPTAGVLSMKKFLRQAANGDLSIEEADSAFGKSARSPEVQGFVARFLARNTSGNFS